MQGENCARALVRALATSRFSSAVAIVIVALVCFLPGFKTLGLIDGDEPGYVVAAREMASTGDFAGVRLQTSNSDWQARGAYWVEALALSIAGSGAPLWVYRVRPSSPRCSRRWRRGGWRWRSFRDAAR